MVYKEKIAHLMMIALIPFMLGGCLPVAAVPLLVAAQYGVSGFMVYKSIRSSVGGSVTVGFGEEKTSPESDVALAAIKRPAIWPGKEIEVAVADKLQSAGAYEDFVTPSQAAKVLKGLDVDADIGHLTRAEYLDVFGKLCESTGADGVIAFQELGVESEMNVFSFSSAASNHRERIVIYSRQAGAVVYESVMEVKEEVGGKSTGYGELLRIAGETAAEKILQLSGRKTG